MGDRVSIYNNVLCVNCSSSLFHAKLARSFITFGVIGLIKHLLQPQIPHIVLRIFCFKANLMQKLIEPK
ncbi:hypothetical protein ACS0TY_022642 [Phlomoides rotata]